MGAVLHHRAIEPACVAARHLNNVPAAGAAADTLINALTTDDDHEALGAHALDRLGAANSVVTSAASG